MSIIRWKPEQELMPVPSVVHDIQQRMNRMFDALFHGDTWDEEIRESLWSPAVDVTEGEKEYIVRMELPGVDRKDVSLSTRDNILTVRGEKRRASESKDSSFHRLERAYGSFQRSFTLPGMVEKEKTEATFRDGVLEVVLPKTRTAQAKAIEVR